MMRMPVWLRTAFDTYVDKGRRLGKASGARGGARKPRGSSSSGTDLAAAREWLRSNGQKVSERGRIAAPLLEEYRASL